MRVDPKNSAEQLYPSTVRNQGVKPEDTAANAAAQKETPKDKIEISRKAADFGPEKAAAAEITAALEKGARAERLRQLKADIESGAYHISSLDIADVIIGNGEKD